MARYQILIVDDQREMRMVLRSGIEGLGAEFQVVDVPSGEEALLEISMEEIDLLVADVRLPGISGLELILRTRAHNPDIKVILITGVADAKTRRQVADAGADAFFLKPVELADFLDAVERCLGLVDSSLPALDVVPESEKPPESVSQRLANLRRELDAFSAVLLDDRGQVLARAGDLPDAGDETAMVPSLMAAFSASTKVAHVLGMKTPQDLFYFGGNKYALFLTHVGQSYAMLVAVNPTTVGEHFGSFCRVIQDGVGDILSTLTHMGVPLLEDTKPPTPEPELEEEAPSVEDEESPLLDALFEKTSGDTMKSEEIDAFWSTLVEEDEASNVVNADVLTYDQARQLGLTPEDEEE
jgi:CheY-like chemotaxis protein